MSFICRGNWGGEERRKGRARKWLSEWAVRPKKPAGPPAKLMGRALLVHHSLAGGPAGFFDRENYPIGWVG